MQNRSHAEHGLAIIFLGVVWFLAMALPIRSVAETIPAVYYSPADRAYAATWLGKMKSQKALPVLLKLCADPDGGVRHAAIEALGALADSAAVTLLEKIAADPRQRSVTGATLVDGPQYRGSAPKTSNHDLQRAAQSSLLLIPGEGGPREAKHAIAELKAMDRAAVRRHYQGGMVVGGKILNVEYRTSGQYKNDGILYSNAWNAIYVISRAPGPEGTVALLEVLACGNENLEVMAARGLCDRPAGQVMATVRNILAQKALSSLTLTACLAIALKHEPSAAQPIARRLVERLKSTEDFHRFPHREQSYLQQALTKGDVPLLKALREARPSAADQAAVDELIGQVEGHRPPVNFLEADEIPEALLTEAIDVFLGELNKEEPDWKTLLASYQLGRLKVKQAIPGLLRLLQFKGNVGYAAYKGIAHCHQPMAGWALVQIGEPETVPRLKEIALDPDQHLLARPAALLTYARVAQEAAVEDLKEALTRKDEHFDEIRHGYALGDYEWPVGAAYESKLQFPTLETFREAAAWGLADAGGEAARETLVAYMNSGQTMTLDIAASIHRLDGEALDTWSQARIAATDQETRAWAVGVRYAFFPDTAGPVAHSIVRNQGDPIWEKRTLTFLRRYPLSDGAVTRTLISLLAKDNGQPTCNGRIELIEAIGRQGGAEAEAVLIEFAEHGRFAGQ